MKIFIQDLHCPGDTLEITAAVRDLCVSHPEFHVNVATTAQELWDHNPYLDRSLNRFNSDICLNVEMPLLVQGNSNCWHSIDMVRDWLAENLEVRIPPGPRQVDLHLTEEEKDFEWVRKEFPGVSPNRPYWIINAGGKTDYTNKIWEFERFQEVVNHTMHAIDWIQIGAKEHSHRPLKNVIDARGETTHREFVRLMYHAAGCLTGLSYPMHLASMQTPTGRARPCIVLNGGREPPQFSAYPGHVMLHTVGMLECCSNGGCWLARVEQLPDGDPNNRKLCRHPVKTASGQTIPRCLDMITAKDVLNIIRNYILKETHQWQ